MDGKKWCRMMPKTGCLSATSIPKCQPRCSSRRMVTFSSPPKHAVLKLTEIRCWWVELGQGSGNLQRLSHPHSTPRIPHNPPTTLIPSFQKKTVVVDEGVHPRFLQLVFWFWKRICNILEFLGGFPNTLKFRHLGLDGISLDGKLPENGEHPEADLTIDEI